MVEIALNARIYVAGHRGLVGSAILRRLEREGFANVLTATRDQLDLRDQAAVNYWFRANRPEYVFLVAGHGRRHPRQLDAPGRVHLRQHDDPRDGRARRAPLRREEAALPRQLVHLPARVPAADQGGVPADRPARADERGLRDRQDRRHQALPGLPPAVRLQLHLGHADESLRPERQLRPHELARRCRR